jgi:hypothetical protein
MGRIDPLVIDEPAQFEQQPVEVQDFRKIAHHSRGIHGIHPQINEGKPEDINM